MEAAKIIKDSASNIHSTSVQPTESPLDAESIYTWLNLLLADVFYDT